MPFAGRVLLWIDGQMRRNLHLLFFRPFQMVHDVPYVYVILKFTLSVDGLPFSLSPPHAVATLQRHGGGGKPTHQISPHFRLSHSDSRHSPYYHDIGTGTIALALALRFPSQLHGLKT